MNPGILYEKLYELIVIEFISKYDKWPIMIRISKREQTRAFKPPPSGAFTNQIPLRERAIARCIFLEQSWIKPTEAPPNSRSTAMRIVV